jgi:hypothetical protein
MTVHFLIYVSAFWVALQTIIISIDVTIKHKIRMRRLQNHTHTALNHQEFIAPQKRKGHQATDIFKNN